MSSLKIKFKEDDVLVIIDQKDQPWFRGSDIIKIMEYKDATYAYKIIAESDKTVLANLHTPNLNCNLPKNTVFINDFGLFYLISRVRKPIIHDLKQWYKEKILPSISKFIQDRDQDRAIWINQDLKNQLDVSEQGRHVAEQGRHVAEQKQQELIENMQVIERERQAERHAAGEKMRVIEQERQAERQVAREEMQVVEQKCQAAEEKALVAEQERRAAEEQRIAAEKEAFQERENCARIKQQNLSVNIRNEELNEEIERLMPDFTPKTQSKNKFHTFTVIEKNEPADFMYYCVRRQRASLQTRMEELRKEFPKSEVILSLDYDPNSINLYNRMKQTGLFPYDGNHFNCVLEKEYMLNFIHGIQNSEPK